jgi:cytochrome c
MSIQTICLLAVIAASIGVTPLMSEPPESGANLFARRCGGCHSLDMNKVGPRLGNVYGRRAGTVPAFMYSEALKNSNLTWDAGSLDKWLAEPNDLFPGAGMDFRVPNPEERRAIIEYLKQLGEK